MVNRYDIVGCLRDYATTKNWHFIYGYDDYVSADFHNYSVDELVFVCEMSVTPNLNTQGGGVEGVNFSGIIMLGRKFDGIYNEDEELISDTTASIDETMLQKHDRRIAELWELLTNALSEIACDNAFDISISNGIPLINFTQHNLDFVKYTVTINS